MEVHKVILSSSKKPIPIIFIFFKTKHSKASIIAKRGIVVAPTWPSTFALCTATSDSANHHRKPYRSRYNSSQCLSLPCSRAKSKHRVIVTADDTTMLEQSRHQCHSCETPQRRPLMSSPCQTSTHCASIIHCQSHHASVNKSLVLLYPKLWSQYISRLFFTVEFDFLNIFYCSLLNDYGLNELKMCLMKMRMNQDWRKYVVYL